MKALHERKHLTRKGWKILFALIIVVCAVLLLKSKKDLLLREFYAFLEANLRRETGLGLHIGKVSGHPFGLLKVGDVRVDESGPAGERRTLFRVQEIQLRYNWLDFLSKVPFSTAEARLVRPEFHWNPHIGLRRPSFPFLGWLRQWALSQRRRVRVVVEDMTLTFNFDRQHIEGVDLEFEDGRFRLEIPLSHVPFGDSDVSSVVKAEGRFELGSSEALDSVEGRIITEGTVINWKPLPRESEFNFRFSKERFEVVSTQLLGGVQVEGAIDFANDFEIDFHIFTDNYPLANMDVFFKGSVPGIPAPGRMDLDMRFRGDFWAPHVKTRALIREGWVSKKSFKAMEVNAEGVYPTVRLDESRILLEDGSSMRFSARALEMKDLLSEETYEDLIGDAQQDTVVWGDWEFKRMRDEENRPEFMMQRELGEKGRLHVKQYPYEEDLNRISETAPVEVGFEYRLRGKDSFKVEVRDDEEFVGVERKMTF